MALLDFFRRRSKAKPSQPLTAKEVSARLASYGLTEAPEAEPAYRAQKLHEYGVTGAEETEWKTGFASSNVAAFRWMPDDPYPLQVVFLNGSRYGYVAPESVYEEMLFARSKGEFVYHVLRKGDYAYQRLR